MLIFNILGLFHNFAFKTYRLRHVEIRLEPDCHTSVGSLSYLDNRKLRNAPMTLSLSAAYLIHSKGNPNVIAR